MKVVVVFKDVEVVLDHVVTVDDVIDDVVNDVVDDVVELAVDVVGCCVVVP